MVDSLIAAPARVCDAVRSILPELQAAMRVTDRDRRLPTAVTEAMRAAGVYRMVVPAALGGDEVDLQTSLDVVELLAEGNGAAGWDASTSSWNTLVALTLPPAGIDRLFAGGPDVAFAGGFAGGGRAVATAGGYRVSGEWRFGSGCAEAAWMMAGGLQVFDSETPRLTAQGQPELRFACVPREEATVQDTWQVAGLRGTGSHDWSLSDAYVPEALTQVTFSSNPWPGTLYRLTPPVMVFNAVGLSAVATGIARRAIDSLVILAKTKTPMGAPVLLRERVQVQEAVARAEFVLESARAYRAQRVEDAWATVAAGQTVSLQQQARLRLAGTGATESAVRAVDLMFQAGGTTAIEDASPLSHCSRDVRVVAQNINLLPTFFERAGRVLLAMEPGTPLF